MFNITCNCPVGLHITKHKNERNAFMDLVLEYPSYKYSVFVFDCITAFELDASQTDLVLKIII
jgi:hypothetical protein